MPFATATVNPLLCLAFVSCLSWLPSSALAAPASSEELSSSAETRGTATGSAGGVNAVPVVPAVTQSKTVELLLQMQDQPQPVGGNDRTGSNQARRAAAPASAAGNLPSVKAADGEDATPLAALKNAILRDATPRTAENSSAATASPTSDRFERQSPMAQGSGEGAARRDPGQGLLSNPVIQYIRENRVMVVSISLGVLAAIWLTASFSMRRGR